jgi:RNA polymerase sigma-70 factor (ECF subfamily)
MDSTVAALPNEVALVARAVAEPAAFAAIYDHYFPRVYNYVRYRVREAEIADDVTAQVFQTTLVKLSSYRPERAPFAIWLFAIARNAVNDHLRAANRRRWLSLDVLWDHPSPEPQPEEAAIQNEARTDLLAALAGLGDRERDLVAMKFAAGLTHRHIAELVGLSESNVGVILYRAMQRLRAELKGKEYDHERTRLG